MLAAFGEVSKLVVRRVNEFMCPGRKILQPKAMYDPGKNFPCGPRADNINVESIAEVKKGE